MDFDEEILKRERLLKLKAGERVSDPNIWEDVLQEGRTVIWEVLSSNPAAPPEYVSAAMSMRITEVVSRQKWTGQPSHRGKEDVTTRRVAASFDDEDFAWEPQAPDLLDDVLSAYHHGELMEALNSLPLNQREYVYRRFWEGRTNAEIAAMQGTTAKALNLRWNNYIKPALRQTLAYMRA